MTSPDERPDAPDDGQSAGPEPGRAAIRRTVTSLAASSRRMSWRLIIPAAVVLIGAVAAIVYLTVGGTSQPAGSRTRPAAAGPSSTGPGGGAKSATKQPAIPPGGVSGSTALSKVGSTAVPLPPARRAAAVRWNAGRGGRAMTAVSSQLGETLQAGGVRQYAQMHAACAVLAAKVTVAQAAPPIPDAAMQKLYARSLAELADGTTACRAAISQQPDGDEYIVTTQNQAKLHLASSAFSAGSRDLYNATAQIEAVSRTQ